MSNFDSFVKYAFSHQTFFIEGIFVIILAIVVVWLFANLQNDEEPDKTTGLGNKELEAILKKVISSVPAPHDAPKPQERTSTPQVSNPAAGVTPTPAPIANAGAVPGAMSASVASPAPQATPAANTPKPMPIIETPEAKPAAAATPAPAPTPGVDPAELAKMKQKVDEKSQRVDSLEKELAKAKEDLQKNAGASGADVGELKKQIQALEGRLKEYAIIEDDIANLSIYKDENAKLKDELAKLRKGGATSVEAPAAAKPPKTDDGGFKEPKIEAVGMEESDPAWPISNGEEQKLDQDFEKIEGGPATEGAVSEIMDHSKAKEGEKLIADFQNFMKGSQ